MIKKPILEKFMSCSENEVLLIGDIEFVLKKINTKQAEYLDTYLEYFIENPLEFVPFLLEIAVDKEKVRNFIKSFYTDYDENKIQAMLIAICVDSLNLRPTSFDYTISNSVQELLKNNSIIIRFISVLLSYGYKKSEIDEFSNNKIIRLALEEMYYRSKSECLLFIADLYSSLNMKYFKLFESVMPEVIKKANGLQFEDMKYRSSFLQKFNNLLDIKPTTTNNNQQNIKMATGEELREKIKQKKSFNDLPK